MECLFKNRQRYFFYKGVCIALNIYRPNKAIQRIALIANIESVIIITGVEINQTT